jgi:hypothetical protein
MPRLSPKEKQFYCTVRVTVAVSVSDPDVPVTVMV